MREPSVLWLPEQHDVRCSARQGGECRHEPGCKPATTLYRAWNRYAIKRGEREPLTRSNVAAADTRCPEQSTRWLVERFLFWIANRAEIAAFALTKRRRGYGR